MRPGELRERRQVMHPLRLDGRRPGRFVPFGAGLFLAEQLVLKLGDHLRVLAVGRHDHTHLLRQLQRSVKFRIIDAERSLVGEEDLPRRGAVVHDPLENVRRLVVEASDAEVERVVARRLAGRLRLPELVRLPGIVGPARTDHLDQRRGAADQGRPARAFVGVLGERPHERQVDVHMRIDEAGEDVPAGRIDHLGVFRRRQIRADRRDRFAFAEDVALEAGVRGHDLAVADE